MVTLEYIMDISIKLILDQISFLKFCITFNNLIHTILPINNGSAISQKTVKLEIFYEIQAASPLGLGDF